MRKKIDNYLKKDFREAEIMKHVIAQENLILNAWSSNIIKKFKSNEKDIYPLMKEYKL